MRNVYLSYIHLDCIGAFEAFSGPIMKSSWRQTVQTRVSAYICFFVVFSEPVRSAIDAPGNNECIYVILAP